jgi:hypothetical protein
MKLRTGELITERRRALLIAVLAGYFGPKYRQKTFFRLHYTNGILSLFRLIPCFILNREQKIPKLEKKPPCTGKVSLNYTTGIYLVFTGDPNIRN